MNSQQISTIVGLGAGLVSGATVSAALQNVTIHPMQRVTERTVYRLGSMFVGSYAGKKVRTQTTKSTQAFLDELERFNEI